MRFFTAIGLIGLALTLVPSTARAIGTYNFTVNLTLKNLPTTTKNGQLITYSVDCWVDTDSGRIGSRKDVTLDAHGNYSGPLLIPVTIGSQRVYPHATWQCGLRGRTPAGWLTENTLWDPSKSNANPTGQIP